MAAITATTHADDRRRGVVYVTASALAWSTAPIALRATDLPPAAQLVWRSLFAALALIALVAWGGRGATLRSFTGLGLTGVAAAVGYSLATTSFVFALGHTSAARVLLFQAISPFVSAALAWLLLRERMARSTAAALALTLAGVVVMVGGELGAGSLRGDVLALVMSLAFGVAILITRYARTLSMAPAMALAMGLAAATGLPQAGSLAVSGRDLAILAAGGLQMAVGLALFSIGARLLPAAEAGLLTILEIVVAPIWVWLLFAERPSGATLAGGAIILTTVVAHGMIELRGLDSPSRLSTH